MTRLLWRNATGQTSVWTVNPNFTWTSLTSPPLTTVAGTGATFGYTGDGLRAWKQPLGGVKTYYLYDGSDPVCEMSGSTGAITFVNTFGVNGLLSRRNVSAGTSTFYTFDERGNVAQRFNAAGTVLSSDLYDSFGARTSTVAQSDPWGFGAQSGYYTDSETGLLLLTRRYYDPQAGRFLTRDPIGYLGGINLYSYTANDPINLIDPLGTNAGWDWYMGGMGGFSDWVDQNLMSGSTANFAQVAGEYDSGCASGWDVAWAGAQFGGNLALNVIPGGGEARAAEVGTEFAAHEAENVVTRGIEFDLDKLSQAAAKPNNPARSTISKVARAIDKHAYEAEKRKDSLGLYTKLTGNNAAKNAAAQDVLDDILTHPDSEVFWTKDGKRFDIHVPTGRGARFEANGDFVGLLGRRRH